MDSPKCIEYVYPGAPKQAIPHPLEMMAHASYEYFEPRQGFSILGIFKNPMLLMMLVSVGMMFLMPKMMEGLDPEQKEQMQRQLEMQQDPSKVSSSSIVIEEYIIFLFFNWFPIELCLFVCTFLLDANPTLGRFHWSQ